MPSRLSINRQGENMSKNKIFVCDVLPCAGDLDVVVALVEDGEKREKYRSAFRNTVIFPSVLARKFIMKSRMGVCVSPQYDHQNMR